ncbi:MAG: MBL fold metallo-hydrolase [Chloroflexi bacterium]|jgi:cyclase|nr:MBL fold metallo-hydrolase [Chloroflexota bacterium]
MIELADGVYVETGYTGGNCGLIRSARGPVLIDTPLLPADGQHWLGQIESVGGGHPYAIVNTDYHPEHLLGNHLFMPARVFGHEESDKPLARYEESAAGDLPSDMVSKNPSLAGTLASIQPVRPEISVSDTVTLHLGNVEVQIIHLEGHTPASLGVYLPEHRILFAGDNVTNHEHPVAQHANSLMWLETLQRIREMDVDVIVPGTGAPGGKEMVEPLYLYLAEMRRRILELFLEGASRRECVEKVAMLDYFPVPKGQEAEVKLRRRHSIERLYTEIRVALRKRH